MSKKYIQLISAIFGFLFVLIMAFPRAFYEFKIIPLLICFVYALSEIIKSKKIYAGSLVFYGVQFIVCLVWICLGGIYGNSSSALIEAARLYILWGCVFLVLVNGMRNINIEEVIDRSVYIATTLICASIFLVVIEAWFDFQVLPDEVRKELNGLVGLHDGYVQVALHSIGSLFFLIPYLIMSVLDSSKSNTKGKKILVIVSLVAVALTGRRALWLIVGMTLSYTLGKRLFRDVVKTTKVLLCSIVGLSALYVMIDMDISFLEDTYSHLSQAFGSDDERTIQNAYLVEKFFENPIFGAGIGFEVGYVRNMERPWLYESTYHVLLAGLGFFGFAIMAINFVTFFLMDWWMVAGKEKFSIIGKPTLVGVLGMLIASYSNPYFGSFDFLFYLSFLPLIFDAKKSLSCSYKL